MSTALTLIDPGQNKYDEQEQLVAGMAHVKKSKKFLKVVKGMTDEKINKMKLADLNTTVREASEDITIGKFEEWADESIKNPNGLSYVHKIWRKIGKAFSTPLFGKRRR